MKAKRVGSASRIRAELAAALLALAALSSPAFAQQIKLRVADSFPAGHYLSEFTTKPWMKAVTEATNGNVVFEYYPAEQLGKVKDMLALTVSGVADIAFVGPSYISEKLPLSIVAELPGSFGTACAGTAAYWKLVREGGILASRDFGPNGVRALFAFVLPPYDLYLAKAKLENLKSIEGLKLRPTSGAAELVTRLNAVPVQVPVPDVRESLSRGTIDGVLFPIASVFAYNVQGLIKYATNGENFGTFAGVYAISEKKWKTLPPNVQKAMMDAGDAITRRTCEYVDETKAKDIERLRQLGVTLVQLSPADKKRLADLTSDGGTTWAEALDKRGKPGTEVLKAFRAALPPAK